MLDPSTADVLVIDDDPDVRRSCVSLLEARGHPVRSAASVGEGLRLLADRSPTVVLLDLKLPDGTGIDVLREVQRLAPSTPVVMISGHGSVGDAVEAMRIGASDFIEKPLGRDRLFDVLERVLDRQLPAAEPDPEAAAEVARYGMVGRSEALRRVQQLIEMAAPTKCRVLVSGESGTGKELIARAIHARSPRRSRAFVALNCAAIPTELIESEMFGHARGAFTGAVSERTGCFVAADAGTLFLDEIGEMSAATQAKLLRVLQEGVVRPVGSSESVVVDVRIVAATSKSLPEETARGRFRDDLYHRINVLTIGVPPLRERREDIAELARHFLRLASAENDLQAKTLTPAAAQHLEQLMWPGNVRELRNLMERLAVLVPGDVVEREHVLDALQLSRGRPTAAGPVPLREARARFERQYILDRLAANRGSLQGAARDLGIERTNLYRKMRQLGIPSPQPRRRGE